MVTSLNFTVESLLSQQVELIGPSAVSLDSLWRVTGCPPDSSPRKWMVLAAPLIAGYIHYLSNLPDRSVELDDDRLLWIWDGEDGEPWRSGDVIAHSHLARVYASFLDSSV
jgi:hypothetical protein